MTKLDIVLEKANNPELKKETDRILLLFHLRIYGTMVADHEAKVTLEKMDEVAKQIAKEQSSGDKNIEQTIYQIILLSLD